MADQNLYALTLEHRRLQQLYDKQQLERKLTAQKQLLKGMSDTKAVLDEIIAIPKTFCDINVRKGQPFLEIDRESGACLQNIKENALEISKGNLINAKEITIPDHLESSMEKLILDSQEQREKNKILSDLLTNTSAISHSKIKSDEKIKTDDVICIKTDSDGMKAQDLLPESPENYVDECNETKKSLYALTLQHRKLQQLYDRQQLERKLTAQKQLLKSMSDTKAVLDEIIAIPKTFCDINVRKGQPFLEIDRESGACLQNIKENALEISKGNLINAKEITIPDHLESSMEKLILDSQEQREKNKILSDLLTNTSAISHSKIKSDEKIKTDDVICIKTDSDGMKAQDLLPESPENYVDECNETKKSLYALTLQHRKLQQLYDRQQLERKLTAQKQLLKSMSDTKAVLDEIIAIPKTFCDINVRKGQPFLEIDRESGACLQNIKENALEISKGNLINAKEITIPDHLESSMEKLILDSQEQREKNKILSDLLTNTSAISHSKIKSDEKIKTDDVICIKTDSDGMKAQDLLPESPENYVDECNETKKSLYALTLQHRKLQQLYDRQQLERKLTAQKQLLKSMSDTKAVLDEIIAIPKTFCDINVRKGQPFLEIDRESGACLQNIKENALEISKGNLINAKEITIPDHLESSMEKLILDSQEQREKNKILSDLLTNTLAISHSKIKSDEKIKTDDVICIKTDSDGMKAQDLLPVSLNDMLPENYVDESNETVKKL